jgi:hypothetical protein
MSIWTGDGTQLRRNMTVAGVRCSKKLKP